MSTMRWTGIAMAWVLVGCPGKREAPIEGGDYQSESTPSITLAVDRSAGTVRFVEGGRAQSFKVTAQPRPEWRTSCQTMGGSKVLERLDLDVPTLTLAGRTFERPSLSSSCGQGRVELAARDKSGAPVFGTGQSVPFVRAQAKPAK